MFVPSGFMQVRVIKLSGEPAEDIIAQWSRRGSMSKAFNVGELEGRAALHLATGTDRDLVKMLASAASRHGVSRGPISHEGLSSKFICLGVGKARLAGHSFLLHADVFLFPRHLSNCPIYACIVAHLFSSAQACRAAGVGSS